METYRELLRFSIWSTFGTIFRAVPRSAQIAPHSKAKAITGMTVRNVIGDAAEAAGLDGKTVDGHSLRRGHLTQGPPTERSSIG